MRLSLKANKKDKVKVKVTVTCKLGPPYLTIHASFKKRIYLPVCLFIPTEVTMQHQVSSYVTLSIYSSEANLSDVPINVFSGRLEASKPHQTPSSFNLGLGL